MADSQGRPMRRGQQEELFHEFAAKKDEKSKVKAAKTPAITR